MPKQFTLIKHDLTKATGSIESLVHETGLTEKQIKSILKKEKDFINGWSYSISMMKRAKKENPQFIKISLVNGEGVRHEGLAKELVKKTGLSLNTLEMFARKEVEAKEGWAISERALKDYWKDNPEFKPHKIYSIKSGKALIGTLSTLLDKTGLDEKTLGSLISGDIKSTGDWTRSAKSLQSIKSRSKEKFTIINLETKDTFTGTLEKLTELTGVSKYSLSNMLKGQTKIVKSFALSDFNVKVFDYKGNEYKGKASDIAKELGLDFLGMARLVQNESYVLKGYSISKKALKEEARDNIKFQKHKLFHVSGKTVEGFIDDISKEIDVAESYIRRVIADPTELAKGWAYDKKALPKGSSGKGFTIFKLDGSELKSITGSKIEIQNSTGLSSYIIGRLEQNPDYSSYGWSFSKDTALNPDETKTFERSKAFDRSRKITLISEDESKTKVVGTIDELIFKLGVTDPMIKRAILGDKSKPRRIRSQ